MNRYLRLRKRLFAVIIQWYLEDDFCVTARIIELRRRWVAWAESKGVSLK